MAEFYYPPAGISPFSEAYTNGAVRAAAPRNWLADKIDPTTGELLSITGGLDPVDAAVAWAFQVKLHRGPALGEAGHEFHKILKADDRAAKLLEDEARRLFAPFIKRGWVALRDGDGLLISVLQDTGSVVANYFNRLAQDRRTVPIVVT